VSLNETLEDLLVLGLSAYEIGAALNTPAKQVHRMRRTKSSVKPPPEVWKPALYKLARERALALEVVAVRIAVGPSD
jgi:hypothetical protein